MKGLKLWSSASLSSQRERETGRPELKSDRHGKWEQKGTMKGTTERAKGRKRESEGEQKTESNWFYDGFQLHGPLPNQLFMTRTHTHTHFKLGVHCKHRIVAVSDNMLAGVTSSVSQHKKSIL